LGKPLRTVTIKQVLDALKRQILFGRTYLTLAKGLREADPVILGTAPTFFGMTLDGSLELAQMAIARMYDEAAGAVTVPNMLDLAPYEIGSFQRGTPQEIGGVISKAKRTVTGLQPVLDAIKHRRDEWLAHLDQRTVKDPTALTAKAVLSIPDLERAFKETEDIVLEFSSWYEGVIGDLRFIGEDDYETALHWIRRAKCAYIEKYEKECGQGSWTGPRPKDCSRKEYDLI
jgi:hypothetical protein